MGCCKSKKQIKKKECPICKQNGNNVHWQIIKKIVKEEMQYIVGSGSYYICTNNYCEVVFFSDDEEQIFLTQDVNMMADFNDISKSKKDGCDKCKGHIKCKKLTTKES